jgi:hypothetical protein
MVELGNLSTQIIFPMFLIATFWFVAFLLLIKIYKAHFNLYMLAGMAWFFLFSAIIVLVLLLSVRITFSSQFFILMTAISSYILWKYFLQNPVFDFSFKLSIGKVLTIFLFSLSIFIVNNWGNSFSGSSYASLGTLHTAKYSYLSEYMVACHNLPLINNNLGQSIVVAFFSLSTNATSTFLLFLLLAFTLSALAFLAYGLFIQFFPDSSKSDRTCALAIFLMGNYALSLAVPIVNDSGNPLFLVGYSDTLISVFYFFILTEFLRKKSEVSSIKKMVLLLPGTLTLWVSAPQALLLIPVSILYLIVKKSWRDSALISSVIVLSSIIWRNQGGMLANLSDVTKIPGIGEPAKLAILGTPSELISPGFPYVINSLNLKNSALEIAPKGIDLFKSLVSERSSFYGLPVIDPERLFWYTEQIFLTTLRPLFWPVFGIAISATLLSRRFHKTSYAGLVILPKSLSPAVILIALNMLLTFPLSFFLQVNSRKWEMTRFSFLNWAIGMYLVALLFLALRKAVRVRLARLILLLTVFPTALYLLIKISTNMPNIAYQLETPVGVIGVINEVIRVNCFTLE